MRRGEGAGGAGRGAARAIWPRGRSARGQLRASRRRELPQARRVALWRPTHLALAALRVHPVLGLHDARVAHQVVPDNVVLDAVHALLLDVHLLGGVGHHHGAHGGAGAAAKKTGSGVGAGRGGCTAGGGPAGRAAPPAGDIECVRGGAPPRTASPGPSGWRRRRPASGSWRPASWRCRGECGARSGNFDWINVRGRGAGGREGATPLANLASLGCGWISLGRLD